MDELSKYVAYFRTECGLIEIMGPADKWVWWPPEMFKYMETLVGWPEKEVFWYHEHGQSFGIAKSAY
jgi:hypothetical protein